MNYIVFDLEFNHDFAPAGKEKHASRSIFEIIQIGAVKLDDHFEKTDIFESYVKPTIYPSINPFITELTGITTEQLTQEKTFPDVYKAFTEFSGTDEIIYCVWGMADLKELYRNVKFHGLDQQLLSKKFINLQPYAATSMKLTQKNMPKLKTAAEFFEVPLSYQFHNALHDAYYTAEIFKRINNDAILPAIYDPEFQPVHTRQVNKKNIDFEGLFRQFEKMYSRELTPEERGIIALAYKMGKTGQFAE